MWPNPQETGEKPMVFWWFQGLKKETSDMEWVNSEITVKSQ